MAVGCPRQGPVACNACAADSNSVSSLLQWLLHGTSLTSTHTARGMHGSAPAGRSTAGMGLGVSEGQAEPRKRAILQGRHGGKQSVARKAADACEVRWMEV